MLGACGLAAVLALAPAAEAAGEEAGNVAVAAGTVVATSSDGTQRTLVDGDPLFSGDTITTDAGSYADLDFLDDTRIVLHPGSIFQIQNYHYDDTQHDDSGPPPVSTAAATPVPQPESAFFRLIKGGLRILDGLIGQTRHDATALETPVATIGVRGTQYDARYCVDDCGDEADKGVAPSNGLYTAVQDGSIGVKNDSGETVINKGEYGQVADRHTPLRRLTQRPQALRHMALPKKFRARAQQMHNRLKAERQRRRMQRQRRLRGGPIRAGGPQSAAAQGAKDKQGSRHKKRKRRRKDDKGGGGR